MYRPNPVRPEIAFDVFYGLGDPELAPDLRLHAWPEGRQWFYEIRGRSFDIDGWKMVWPFREMCRRPKPQPDLYELYVGARLLTVAVLELKRQRVGFIDRLNFASERRQYAALRIDERIAQIEEAIEALRHVREEDGDGAPLAP